MKLAVIGDPVAHSLSPFMHRIWLADAQLSHSYDAVRVAPDDLEDFLASVRGGSFLGFNVTVPHKEAIIPYLDNLAPQARRIGAVNTVLVKEGKITGFNTDGLGFLKPLTARGVDLQRPVLLLGAGGAARAIMAALLTTEVPLVMVYNRTRTRAEELVAGFGSGRATVVEKDFLADAVAAAGLVVNSTSAGMDAGSSDDNQATLVDLGPMPRDGLVYDIVYTPLVTPLLKQAHTLGFETIDGLDMLVHQGAQAFKIWTGLDVDTAAMRSRLEAKLAERGGRKQ